MYLFMLVSRLLDLRIFGCECGCLGLEKLASDLLQKQISTEVGTIMIPGCILYDLGGGAFEVYLNDF